MKIKRANYHILIVEDEPLLSMNYYDALKELNYNVSRAMSLRTAKNILSSSFIDIIILDGDLPDGKGTSLIPFIENESSTSINKNIPIIFLSAYGGTNKESLKFEYNIIFDEILQKPIATSDLVNYVNKVIDKISVTDKNNDRYTKFINDSERKKLLNLALYDKDKKNNEKQEL